MRGLAREGVHTIWTICYNIYDTLASGKRGGNGNSWFAESAETDLLDSGKKLGPVSCSGIVSHHGSEQPCCSWVSRGPVPKYIRIDLGINDALVLRR